MPEYCSSMAKILRVVPCVIVFVAVMVAIRLALSDWEFGVPQSLAGIKICRAFTGTALPASTSLVQGHEREPLRVLEVGQALLPFVFVSASRDSLSTFHVLGLISRVIRAFDKGDMRYECIWRPGNGTDNTEPSPNELLTRAQLLFGNTENFKVPYTMVILTCPFEVAAGGDGLGGSLHIRLHVGPVLGQESTFVAVRESVGYDVHAMLTAPPPYKYVFCGAAIAGTVHIEVIKEWLIYHLYIAEGQKAHFILYDIGGLTEEGRKVLDPFVTAGFVTFLDVSDQTRYPSWYHGQVLLINECLHRTRFLAEWTVFLDFDEFLYAEPPYSFSGIINENANASVLTFGSWPISIGSCRPAEEAADEWQLERMLWRRPQPECRNRNASPWLCLAAGGRRKYAVNPRKEFYASIHQTLGQTWKSAVHLNASDIRLEHYQGLLAKDACQKLITPLVSISDHNQTGNLWIQQQSGMRPVIRKARAYARHVLKDTSL